MKWLPRTLFGQILLAMITGFVIAQAVGVWLLLAERSRLGDRLRVVTRFSASPASSRCSPTRARPIASGWCERSTCRPPA